MSLKPPYPLFLFDYILLQSFEVGAFATLMKLAIF